MKVIAAALLIAAIMFGLVSNAAAHPPARQSSNRPAHLYFFTNVGCPPCRQVEPGITALKGEGYPVTTVYVNDRPELAQQFSITVTPTVVMVANNQIVGRHEGLIDGATLKRWFAEAAVLQTNSGSNRRQDVPAQSRDQPTSRQQTFTRAPRDEENAGQQRSTIHTGTRTPGSEFEALALQATVRLKVEDSEGISWATGTVVHCHEGECLVMTCGHVFRESAGKGVISAEFGFEDGTIKTAPGQLISYDSDARDIALVAIRTNEKIVPVRVASRNFQVGRGLEVFSVGCDHGDDPTIRRTEIKKNVVASGEHKYDILGRPVDGRSGGGLFNERGELIGICNAAVVNEDVGIYTALDTIYWQIAHVSLDNLFSNEVRLADNSRSGSVRPDAAPRAAKNRLAATGTTRPLARLQPPTRFANADTGRANRGGGLSRLRLGGARPSADLRQVSWENQIGGGESDREVIIIVRSKSDPSQSEAITISQPGPQLLDYLESMRDSGPASRQINVVQLRKRAAADQGWK